jgi:hypothetical protein
MSRQWSRGGPPPSFSCDYDLPLRLSAGRDSYGFRLILALAFVILNGAQRSEGSGLRTRETSFSVARSFAALRMTRSVPRTNFSESVSYYACASCSVMIRFPSLSILRRCSLQLALQEGRTPVQFGHR